MIDERQKQILVLSAEGYKSSFIAIKLGISVNTVNYHKKKIFTLLDADNIVEAVSIAIKNGLI